MKITNDILEKHLDNIRALRSASGLFMASRSDVNTGYNKAWLRDNFYTCLAFEEVEDWDTVRRVWKALLQIFVKHKDKIDWARKNKPYETWQYIHARYHPETFEEFWEEWGNKRNDAVGEILWKLGDLEERGIKIIETPEEKLVVQILVDYLESIEYWHNPDNGVWEEYEELHMSSVGACVAGLRKVKSVTTINVHDYLIEKGEETLRKFLPRESNSKFADLALLSLIYPFNVVNERTAREIVRKVEYHLERDRGIIRYKNDRYYNKNEDGFSEEAEWCFGFPWLSIIYNFWGDSEKSHFYLQKSISTIYNDQIPELYYSDSPKPNENVPLAWAESLFVVAMLRAGR